MSKEEPAWKAELEARVADLFRVQDGKLPDWTRMVRTADALGSLIGGLVEPHIRAAEQRGFQAGVNKTGHAVGELRVKLRTAREDARREAATEIRYQGGFSLAFSEHLRGMAAAADLIDPDKP